MHMIQIKSSTNVCWNYYDIVITLKAPNSINPTITVPRPQKDCIQLI